MSLAPDYAAFLAAKAPRPSASGIAPSPLPSHLFDFQAHCVDFLLRQGRGGLFLGTGLGKTACQLEWAHQAARATNGRALILTPLAVARQTEREAHRFGYEARVIRDQSEAGPGISICNYDRLDRLDPAAFGAVSLDEGSILKAFAGATTRRLIEAFRGHRFRLSATATPAPNDHMEVGQQSEFLGQMPASEMLMRWFINDTSKASQEWRLKRHGEADFWDWMASWSRMADGPEDLGFDGSAFVLPGLQIVRHQAVGDARAPAGALFVTDLSATAIHDMKRQTAAARAEVVANLVAGELAEPWVVWCDTNQEADELVARLPEAVEVRGSHSIEAKEDALDRFSSGDARVIITKPSVAGFGCNWQHAARMAFVGRSFSYEQWYQAVRRCWRFGQARPVQVHVVVAEGEDQIGRVIDRKAADHARMKEAMAAAMMRTQSRRSEVLVAYEAHHVAHLPHWIRSAA